MTGSTPRRRVSPRLPCPKCRKLCPIEARICTCGHWLIRPSTVNDEGSVSLSPGLDVAERRPVTSRLNLAASPEKEEALSFRDPSMPTERDSDFALPVPSLPKQVGDFVSLLTGTEPGESSQVVSSATPGKPGKSQAPISNGASVEPSGTSEVLSNSSVVAPRKLGRSLSSPTPTTPRELKDTLNKTKSAAPKEKEKESAGLNPTETGAVSDVIAKSNGKDRTELEKVFAEFRLPGRGEKYESRATAPTGYNSAWKRSRISIGRIEVYLAIVALFVFVASVLTYWIQPFADVSDNPEVTAQNSDDSSVGSELRPRVVEGDTGTKQGEGIESPTAFEPSSEERSQYRRVQGSSSENSLPNGAESSPSRPATARTTESAQPASGNALPTRKRARAETKKVTVDDLITDKKKITVDDLINDN